MESFHYVNFLKRSTLTKDGDILVVEAHAIGDVFHTLTLIDSLREKYGNTRKINLACKSNAKGVVNFFKNIDNLCLFNEIDRNQLRLIAHTKWHENQDDFLLCYPYYYTERFNKNENWMDQKKELLGLPSETKPKTPKIDLFKNQKAVNKAIDQGVEKNSLIIFNHASSIKNLSAIHYRDVIKNYPGKVFYDSWNTDPIPGAVPLNIDLYDIPYFAEIAGNALCIRSGVADFLSISNANVSVIYPWTKFMHDYRSKESKLKVANDFRTLFDMEKLELNNKKKWGKIYIEDEDEISVSNKKIQECVLNLYKSNSDL